MYYNKIITLKDGRSCLLRSCTQDDAARVLDVFLHTHEQTDNMLTYPDESTMTVEQEAQYLKALSESSNEVEILAEVDGVVAGTAGINAIGTKYKICHRADFGIGIDRGYWGLGIGRELTRACIKCAADAGYTQIELNVVADNERAAELYKSLGFIEYGRNPRGFRSRASGYQELIYMRKELD